MLYAVSSTRLEFCVYFFCHMKDDGSGVLKALCLRDFPGRKTLLRPRAAWPSSLGFNAFAAEGFFV